MNFRKYLTWAILIILLLFGPIEYSWSKPLIIRMVYLILIPTFVWLLVGWLWKYFNVSFKVDEILSRILSGAISIGIFTLAYYEATSRTHLDNTNYAVSSYEIEPIGENIIVNGPNWGNVLFLIIFALAFIYYGVIKTYPKNTEEEIK